MLAAIVDSVLLFSFSIPIVMQYRILPVEGTPYWLFGVLFFVLVFYVIVSVRPDTVGVRRTALQNVKLTLLIITLCITLGGSAVTAMVDRAKTAPVYGVHDIILQQEAAMRYLLVGKNPYKETYFGTPVESFRYAELGKDAVNPALYHFVMPPWYLLFPFLFYFPSVHFLNFFDGRMVSVVAMAMLLTFVWYWFKDKHIARIAVILTSLSPSVVHYFIEGRSDVFALCWLVGAFMTLEKRRYIWSGALLALSAMSKQTTWFALPFYAVYLWQTAKPDRKSIVPVAAVFFLIIAALTTPFLLWDPRAFVESVIFYLSGNAAQSYPISGYGLGMLLFDAGIISDIHAYYPFIFWQLAIALPLFLALMRHLARNPTGSSLILTYAVFLTVYWYLSRYFNNSHLGYLSMVFALGGLKYADESS